MALKATVESLGPDPLVPFLEEIQTVTFSPRFLIVATNGVLELLVNTEAVLKRRPSSGQLFPYLCTVRAGDRTTEFKQRCDGLNIKGVSLHSYRYAWAERTLKCGFPERFAQQALGHNSKAVHRAYAKHAEVAVPSLDDWEKAWGKKPHQNGQSKLLPVDFRSPLAAIVQSN
jgi:integrase